MACVDSKRTTGPQQSPPSTRRGELQDGVLFQWHAENTTRQPGCGANGDGHEVSEYGLSRESVFPILSCGNTCCMDRLSAKDSARSHLELGELGELGITWNNNAEGCDLIARNKGFTLLYKSVECADCLVMLWRECTCHSIIPTETDPPSQIREGMVRWRLCIKLAPLSLYNNNISTKTPSLPKTCCDTMWIAKLSIAVHFGLMLFRGTAGSSNIILSFTSISPHS